MNLKNKTFGEAVDEAINIHEKLYPTSYVYQVRMVDQTAEGYRIWLEAEHFPGSVVYKVPA